MEERADETSGVVYRSGGGVSDLDGTGTWRRKMSWSRGGSSSALLRLRKIQYDQYDHAWKGLPNHMCNFLNALLTCR
jgi:hypothetical protein